MITVVVPFYGAPELLAPCVQSLLGQTYRDLRVVVIADGVDVPPLPSDPRLAVYRLPENRGVYFAQALALAACDSEWFSIHAHDDWSDRDRFERLMQHATPEVDAVLGGSIEHRGATASPRRTKWHRGGRRPRHIGSIATGVFRTSALRELGWWSHPEFRVGYDSMMTNLVVRHLRWIHVPGEFGYHRVVRRDSLTRSPATGLRSEYRAASTSRRAALWNEYADRPALIPVADDVAADVLGHAEQLRRQLWEAVAA